MNAIEVPARPRPAARWAVWGCLLALMLPFAVLAQGAPPGISDADQAEIVAFNLNEDVLARLEAVTREGRTMEVKKSQLDMTQVHSLDDMAAQMVANDPRIKPLLEKHGFTPHQFLVANLALVGTAMAVHMSQDPKMAQYVDQDKLNQHNLSFYKAHQAQIEQMMKPPAQTQP